MRYGIILEGGDFRQFGEMAAEAEAAGWDGVFIADALSIETKTIRAFPWFDPWVVLAQMAMRTERIRLGTMITPVPRRRPWKLAREVVTLDQLSNGRMILATGLGAAKDDAGFYKVGEAMDLKVRAQLLDEGLAILAGLWRGKRFSHCGEHYRVDKMTMLPTPVQSPRVPLWVVGVWPKEKSMQRAMRWDGIIPQKYKPSPSEMLFTPQEIRALKKHVDENRTEKGAFDIVAGGSTPGEKPKKAADIVRPFIEAGATWWIESVWSMDPNKGRKRLNQGPPRVEG